MLDLEQPSTNIAQSVARSSRLKHGKAPIFFKNMLDFFSQVTLILENPIVSVMTALPSEVSWLRMLNISSISSWKNVMAD